MQAKPGGFTAIRSMIMMLLAVAASIELNPSPQGNDINAHCQLADILLAVKQHSSGNHPLKSLRDRNSFQFAKTQGRDPTK
jgi:hypothetical protein